MMTDLETRPLAVTLDLDRSASPSPPLTTGSNTPSSTNGQSPSKHLNEKDRKRQQRHSKKLSINFPILVPQRGVEATGSNSIYTASPVMLSTYPLTQGAFFSPPSMSSSTNMPLTPPSELETNAPQANARGRGHTRQESTSTEFLTLLASQERRVLELKEELSRAENELVALKKRWALHEAGKKKGEGSNTSTKPQKRHTKAASVAEAGTAAGLGLSGIESGAAGTTTEDRTEAEREKMRELVRERMLGRWPQGAESSHAPNGNARKGQRVFSSSKHTRTLSLLTTTTTRNEQTNSTDGVTHGKTSLDSARQPSSTSADTSSTPTSGLVPTLSRSNSGLEALNLGKTYKDLANAASRKNLPPGLNPEQFVKQGKQMVDGVRDGLWNFFEDIRQATVGDEAVSAIRRQNSMKQAASVGNAKLKRSGTDACSGKENDVSFWREFGVDTPKTDKARREQQQQQHQKEKREGRPSLPGRWPSTKIGEDFTKSAQEVPCCPKHSQTSPKKQTRSHGKDPSTAEHHESKTSTDSGHPPSLVDDMLDEEEEGEEEGWENWERSSTAEVDIQSSSPSTATRRHRGSGSEVAKEVQWHGLAV